MRSYLLGYLYVRRKYVFILWAMKLILPCAHVSFAFLATYFLYTPTEFACDHSNLGSRVATQPLISYFCRLVSNSPKLTSASMSPNRHKGVLFLKERASLLRSNLKKLVKMNQSILQFVCVTHFLVTQTNCTLPAATLGIP